MRPLAITGTPLMILALLFVSGGDEPGQAKTYVGPVAAPIRPALPSSFRKASSWRTSVAAKTISLEEHAQLA